MLRIADSVARQHLPAVLETAQREPVLIERDGQAIAVVLSVAEYELLKTAAEDLKDITEFDAAMAEEGPNIPWKQVEVNLGW